jgi:peptidyl-prolyl cis-trans isomerase C
MKFKSGKWFEKLSPALCLVLFMSCSGDKGSGVPLEKARSYANALVTHELYGQALDAYRRILNDYTMDDQARANMLYMMGNLYFKQLHDYNNALALYLQVKYVHPDEAIINQINERIVQCLERLRRSADAEQALNEALGGPGERSKAAEGETVIARIGDRDITGAAIQNLIDQLPENIQSRLEDRGARLQFVKQFLANELIYEAAKRKGLDSNPGVVEGVYQARKALMVQLYLQEELAGQVNVSEDDLALYYKANPDRYTETDDRGNRIRLKSLDEVRRQVAEDYVQEKQEKLVQELMQRMLNTKNVEIYEDRIQ